MNAEIHREKTLNTFWMNLFASFTPVFFCTISALYFHRHAPLFAQQAYDVLFIGFLYALPWLVSSAASQYLLTRYSSRNVIVYSRLLDVVGAIFATIFALTVDATGFAGLGVTAVFMGLNFSGYRPALKVYASAMVEHRQLPQFAAAIEAATFGGITLGVAAAVAALKLDLPLALAAAVTIPAAVIGRYCSFSLVSVVPPKFDENSRYREPFPLAPPAGLKKQQRYRELILTGVGECYVFGAIILISSMAIHYLDVQFTGNLSDLHRYFIMGSPVVGAALGVLSSGRRSRGNIEIGIVPGGTLLMTLSALCIGLLPLFGNYGIENALLALLLFLFGFAAGSILVPLQCYQCYFIKKELAVGFFSWYYLAFSAGILAAMGLTLLAYYYTVGIFTVMLVISLLTLTLALITFTLMPQFLLRMLMRLLLSLFYRVRIFHIERLPETGPALLVANRASFVDMLFLSACTSRPIRFMMHEHYYRTPVLQLLYRSIGFLEVPSRRPKRLKQLIENTRQLLKNGELICVFPEDDITRNGTMSTFRDGVGNLLPEDVDIPIIPMRIGMTWGSIFSCSEGGKFKLRMPRHHRHPASVTIGEPMPRDTDAYTMRIIFSELAAETELVADREDYPLHTRFARLAKKHPFRANIMECEAPNWKRPGNFRQLVRMALLSRFLRKKLLADREEYVGVMLPNTLDFAAAFLAIQTADRVPAVLNYTASREAIDAAIRRADLRHILTTRKFVAKAHLAERPEFVYLEDIEARVAPKLVVWRYWVSAWVLPADELMRQLSPQSWHDMQKVGAVIFSSGSTGIPKGVMLTHHNIISDVLSVSTSLGWSKSDSVVGNLPLFHSFGMAVCFWMPIVTGTPTVLIPNALDAASVGVAMRTEKLSVLCATPGFLQIYMRKCAPSDFASLRIVITGAEKLRDDVAEKFRRLTGIVITEGYGCTELSPVVSINLAASIDDLGSQVVVPGSIGPPLVGVCAKVVDPSTFRLMPEDTDGLLLVKGAIVMKGYLGEEERTREVIRDNWYVTGDIARMNRNGFITITGRLSRFSKISGEMVPHELVEREIDTIVHSEERIVAVTGVPDEKRGEKLLVFYTDAGRIAPEQLVKQLRARGIPNLWLPRPENFIHIDAIPTLGNGKLDLAALKILAEKAVTDA